MALPDKATTLALPYFRYSNLDGSPAFNVKAYIGVANTDPTIIANQIDVSAVGVGQALTVLTQPIRSNAAGYLVDDIGNIAYPIIVEDYSIRVDTSADVLLYEESFVESLNAAASGDGILSMTLAEAIANEDFNIEDAVIISDRADGIFDLVLASGVTPNTFEIVQCVGAPTLALVLRVQGENILVDQFGANETDDARGPIQAVIDFAQARSGNSTITSNGLTYVLKSTIVEPTYGGNVGLSISNTIKPRFDFNKGKIEFDETDLALGALTKDAVIALAPDGTSGFHAFGQMRNMRVGGGEWVDPAHRPINVIRGDYIKLGYHEWEDVQCEFASGDVVSLNQFVGVYIRCRSRFAGTLGAGFKFDNVEGSGGGNTSITMIGCSADNCGLYGFLFTGGNGHAYSSLISCTADFIGYDDDMNTIVANVGTSFAYRIENVRVFNIENCGVEFSTALFSGNNMRSLRIDGLFGVGLGNTDNVSAVPEAIKFTGFCEQVNVANIDEDNSPKAGGFTNVVTLETPVDVFNSNNYTFDQSISKSNIVFTPGGNDSSSPTPLITSPQDLYFRDNRRGPGDVTLTGNKNAGAHENAWYASTDVIAQTFKVVVAGTTPILLNLWEFDDSAGGDEMIFQVDILQCRSGGNRGGAAYQGMYHFQFPSTVTVQEPEQTTASLMPNSGTAPTFDTTGDIVSLSLPNDFTSYYVKVTASSRQSANYPRINWMPRVN